MSIVDANQLVETMRNSYRELHSYQDSGYLLTVLNSGEQEENTTRIAFNTFFCEPNLFQFDWTDNSISQASFVWSDGRNAFTKHAGVTECVRCDEDDVGVLGDLELALGAASGVSSGAALSISSLLFPSFACSRITDLEELCYVGTDSVNGELCHSIQGSSRGDKQVKLWISATRFVVLKMRQQYKFGPENLMDAQKVAWLFKRANTAPFSVRRITKYQDVKLNTPIRTHKFPLRTD